MKNLNVKVCALVFACALMSAASPGATAARTPQLAANATNYAGKYRHKTYRPGKEGYDNTLEVRNAGGGRLHVTLSGTYIYKADGEETMHEGGGEGDAVLRGNVATARVTPDGGGEPCRVLIIFEGPEAGVKAGSDCNFNVDLDGTYRSGKAGASRAGAGAAVGGPRQVRFDKLADFVGDHQANKTGAHFVVTSVPAEKVGRVAPAGRRGMFYLQFDESDGDASTSLIASAELARNLRNSPVKEAATLRVKATLVEFVGCCDVYRSAFVTAVEGYGEDGSLLWVATGGEPAKVSMRQ